MMADILKVVTHISLNCLANVGDCTLGRKSVINEIKQKNIRDLGQIMVKLMKLNTSTIYSEFSHTATAREMAE